MMFMLACLKRNKEPFIIRWLVSLLNDHGGGMDDTEWLLISNANVALSDFARYALVKGIPNKPSAQREQFLSLKHRMGGKRKQGLILPTANVIDAPANSAMRAMLGEFCTNICDWTLY